MELGFGNFEKFEILERVVVTKIENYIFGVSNTVCVNDRFEKTNGNIMVECQLNLRDPENVG